MRGRVTGVSFFAFILTSFINWTLLFISTIPFSLFKLFLLLSIVFFLLNMCLLYFLARSKQLSEQRFTFRSLITSSAIYPILVIVLVLLCITFANPPTIAFGLGVMVLYITYKIAFVIGMKRLG